MFNVPLVEVTGVPGPVVVSGVTTTLFAMKKFCTTSPPARVPTLEVKFVSEPEPLYVAVIV